MKRSKKPLPKVNIISYGKYTRWDNTEKNLPALEFLTDKIKAELDLEFGLIVEIRQAKGRFINYLIDHPPFRNEKGELVPSFTGEYQIRTNPAKFFLGDSILFPIDDKKGKWTFKIKIDDKILAEKKIEII